MDSKAMVVIGNGFDVALGFKTRYGQFYSNSAELRHTLKMETSSVSIFSQMYKVIYGATWRLDYGNIQKKSHPNFVLVMLQKQRDLNMSLMN